MIETRVPVISNERVARDTYLMRLQSPEIAAEAKPGQFIMLRVSEGIDPLLRRPFSIAGTSEELLLVLYRVVGRGTSMMTSIGAGECLSVLGPLGTGFSMPRKGETAVLVAGGIGMPPLLFLAQSLRGGKTLFLSGFRSAVERIPLEAFDLPPMEAVLATDDGTAGHHGFVTDLLLKHWSSVGDSPHAVYSCGPLPMLKKVATLCLEKGIPCQVSLEAFMACGLGACQGCAVKAAPGEGRPYHHVCRHGPVFQARTVDWQNM